MRPRAMVWAVAAACASAGIGAGAALAMAFGRPAPVSDSARRGAEQFVESLRDRYALSPDQARLLRAAVLDELSSRQRILLSLSRQDVPGEVQRELDTVKRKLDTRIEYILEGEQRTQWKRELQAARGK